MCYTSHTMAIPLITPAVLADLEARIDLAKARSESTFIIPTDLLAALVEDNYELDRENVELIEQLEEDARAALEA